jgi:hypothetical protein
MTCQRLQLHDLPKASAFGIKNINYELSKDLGSFGVVYKESKTLSFQRDKDSVISPH